MTSLTFKKKITDENIDPLNTSVKTKWEIFIPGMRTEHIERYKFAGNTAKSLNNPQLKLLDVGCGYGYGAKVIKKIIPKINIIGIDQNSSALAKAQENYSNYATFIKGDIRRLPFENNSFDIITCFEVAEHLEEMDQQKFIFELTRVLKKKSGILILSVPYPNATYKFVGKVFYSLWGSGFHKYEPTFTEMHKMLENAGFNNILIYGQGIINALEARVLSMLNKIIPIWGLYAWLPKRDHVVHTIPRSQTAIIGIFVAKSA